MHRYHFRVAIFLLAASLSQSARADKAPRILNGIDVLREQKFAPLEGKKVGLVTHHTGRAADGATTIDLLYKSGVCRLVTLVKAFLARRQNALIYGVTPIPKEGKR